MQAHIDRRTFLRGTGLTLAAWGATPFVVSAVEPFQRDGAARMPLSLAAYSFRDHFKDASHERERPAPEDQRIDLFQFLDFCANHRCQGAELTSYYFPKDVTRDFLLRLRRHAFLQGLEISGTAVGNTFTYPPGRRRDREIRLVKTWIDHAATMGAPHVRVFAGSTPDGADHDQAKRHCIEALEECCEYAGRAGIFLGIENHGGIVAEAKTLLEIIRNVDSPWLGINLDTGNFHTDDPYQDLAACAPYAVNVQLKVEMRPRGKSMRQADLKRLVAILREARYQGYVVLEYEAAADPWQAVPEQLTQLRGLLS